MSKIQDVPFITKVIDTLSDELKSGLYDLIDGQVKTPIFRSLVNNDYAITEANDKGKVQFVTLETLRGNYTGYLAYNSVYCVLIAFKGNTQALDMLNINVAKHTFAFVNESLSILELRVELEDSTELTTLMSNIVDSQGNKRFVEGNGAVETAVDGLTITYKKWSLSGTHIMFVLAGTFANGTELPSNTDLISFDLPTFILNKITSIWRGNIENKNFSAYADDWSSQNGTMVLRKIDNKIIIRTTSEVTFTKDRNFRIQFDLLIDSE